MSYSFEHIRSASDQLVAQERRRNRRTLFTFLGALTAKDPVSSSLNIGSMEMPKRQSSCSLTDKSKAWKYLAGIKLSSLQPNKVTEDFYEEPEDCVPVDKSEPEVYTVSNAMVCSLCDCIFEDRHQQKAHYRLDWHRFNLKQRIMGLKSVSEEAFSQQADDVSSISGSGDSSSSDDEDEVDMSPVSRGSDQAWGRRKKASSIHKYDSDDDDDNDAGKERENGRRCPRIYFDNDDEEVVSVYRCIIHGKREAPTTHTELISRTLGLLTNQKWAIILTGGGHFAAAVYDGPEVIEHKTFHRYTVRAKRGTVQSVRDSQGNAPKSGGASIRRYNEAALNQEVQNLLTSWKDHLDSCSRIFLRVPTYNKAMFYGGKSPALVKGDDRVVTIPFATRRATFKELKRVWEVLATIESHGTISDITTVMASRKEKKVWKKGKKSLQENEKQVLDEEDASLEVILSRLEKQSLEEPADNSTSVKMEEKKNEKDDEEVDDIELHEEEVITSTDHLKEYETTPKKQRRRKKKKPERQIPQTDKEEENLTTELFTICRTGNMDKLEEVLQKIQQHFGIPPHNPPHNPPTSKDSTKEHFDRDPSNTKNTSSDDTNPIPSVENKDNILSCKGDVQGMTAGLDSHVKSCQSSDDSHKDGSGNKNSVESRFNLPEPLNSTAVFNEDTQNNPNRADTIEGKSSKSDLLVESKFDEANVPSQHKQVPDDDSEVSEDKAVRDSKDHDKPSPGVLKFLNKPLDDMGYSFLHVAAEDGQGSVLYRLMECGADPGVKSKKGKPAFGCSFDRKTREEFRSFRSDHPNRYDYERAQIPVPLTEEQEKEKAAKQSERKRNARKAKRLKEKEQKEVKEAERKENEKKEWYANLSEREKRALAAEKRFAQQVTPTSDMQRCWTCGSSLAGKAPFSYMDFKFCSMPCLKKHKQQPK
ncbi:ankyrin repeat and zinc finger domain-containing protein 1 isoform X2 [Strongylocentrotus purpuratus]|uniref:VLRF1 domain-containing protein n=1 Tax=Strongylocentrotus purpuratus TaxID=7668 RepID=A0A7M7P9H5_STRPU|nr:ankyrin repeat and zinc finger domain-containing protein 1 isoform X2 [Strongylocentrotus purpuratus]